MSSEWPSVRLGDLLSIRHGWPFKSEFFQVDNEENSSLPIVVAIGNFEYTGGFRFQSTQIKRYSDSFPSDFMLKSGDILLVMTCQTVGGEILGIPAKVPDDGRVYLHNQRLGRAVFCDESLFPDFAYWIFLTSSFNKHLVGSATGTKILHTAPSRIESFRFQFPPIGEQVAVAGVLNEINDRITLLRETNATLEAIAQALFKSWFIDFDPVHAKMEGRAPEGMNEATAALFPDSFEETELGAVPRGWSVGVLSALLRLHKGSVNPGGQPDTEFQHFSLPAFDAGQTPVTEFGSEIKSNKTSVPVAAVLLSKLNPHIPRIWLPSAVGSHAVCSTEFLPFVPNGPSTTAFVYCLLSAPDFSKELCQLVTGTSNSHQRIKPDGVLSLQSVIPPSGVITAFDGVVGGLLERVKVNRIEVQTLATLRDTLLPRLISGQLRLPVAQDELEAA